MYESLDDPLPLADDLSPHKDPVLRGRRFIGIASAAALVAAAAVYTTVSLSSSEALTPPADSKLPAGSVLASLSPEQAATEELLLQAGESLLALGEESHGGLRFRSEIQSPHYQTDRDVGAAGIGVGFLALAERYPNDSRWLGAAQKTATWLTAVSKQDGAGGRYWPDYADDGDVSGSQYTSFDDGAIGIGDFYYRLFEATDDPQYKVIAMQSVEWTLSQAESSSGSESPIFRWRWDASDSGSPYYIGMGQGLAGIIDALETFHARTKDTDPEFAAECHRYAIGALRYLDQVRSTLGNNGGDNRSIPETGAIGQDGDTTMDAGYLSGAAGAAFMFLRLFQATSDSSYRDRADTLLSWLDDTTNGPKVDFGDGTAAWKLSLDPRGGSDPQYATGMEEGAAGIGWTYLQAHRVTGDERYLATAKQAANWLLRVAVQQHSALAWREDEHPASSSIHANLNNGAAGIGMFLMDMYQATKDQRYLVGAQGAQRWLAATALHDGNVVYWQDVDNGSRYAKDPSWHWGSAGIVAFLLRMSGGTFDMPGMQEALSVR